MSKDAQLSSGRIRRGRLATLAALVGAAALIAVATPVAQAATTDLAASPPSGLVQSTGNLYWTANTRGLGPQIYVASVWRASKYNLPGQESLLYQERSASPFNFAAIKWAYVDGQYDGYFVANYPAKGVSKIKRVSLAGGTAVTLATSPAQIGTRDLVTDGTNLYWADAKGIREMPIDGGHVVTLAKGTSFSRVSLDATSVYYSSLVTAPDGSQEAYLNAVDKTGGSSVPVAATSASIEALDTRAMQFDTEYYLGLSDGSVVGGTTLSVVSGGLHPPLTLQTACPGCSITSLSLDPDNLDIFWGEVDLGYDVAVTFDGGSTTGVITDAPPIDLQGDGSAMYWGDAHLEKSTF